MTFSGKSIFKEKPTCDESATEEKGTKINKE